MKSTDVYKVINSNIKDLFKTEGFKKIKSNMLGYSKKYNDNYLIFWFQISRDGFDQFSGSKFIVEFSVRENEEIYHGGIEGGRIGKYLQENEFDEVLNLQNMIIAKLKKPPKNYPTLHINENVTRWYLQKFELLEKKYNNKSDIWFRYHNEDDVIMWAQYLKYKILNITQIISAIISKENRPTTAST